MFSLVLKLMKKACTIWHWPGLEGNKTVRILAILLRFNREVAHDLGGSRCRPRRILGFLFLRL
jgi:hypothetical protein